MLKKTSRIKHFFVGGRHFQAEFRRQIRMLIVVTLGFTIAFTWRQTLFDVVQTAVEFFTNIQNSATLSILTSTATTLIALLVIYFASKFLQDKPDY